MRNEYKALAEACCSPTAPTTIVRAPKPETFVEANLSFEQFEKKEELETFLL